jgi:hypothetical protein
VVYRTTKYAKNTKAFSPYFLCFVVAASAGSGLAPFEDGLAFLQKGAHALLPIFTREAKKKQVPLSFQSLRFRQWGPPAAG